MSTWEKQEPSIARVTAHALAHPVPAITRGKFAYWAVRHIDGTRPRLLLLGVQSGRVHDALTDTAIAPLLALPSDQFEYHPMSQDLDKVDLTA